MQTVLDPPMLTHCPQHTPGIMGNAADKEALHQARFASDLPGTTNTRQTKEPRPLRLHIPPTGDRAAKLWYTVYVRYSIYTLCIVVLSRTPVCVSTLLVVFFNPPIVAPALQSA